MPQVYFEDNDTPVRVSNIYCIGRNYREHAAELNNPVPKEPMVFLKPTCTIVRSGATVLLPAQSSEVHHEIEVVLLIGKEGKNIKPADALAYIAGYGIGIDMTARDIQSRAKEKGHPWSVAKGFETFAPVSAFAAADRIRSPQELEFSLRINDELRQTGNTADMIFPITALISHLSSIFRLLPGDLVFTGTPAGVGPVEDGEQLQADLQDPPLRLRVNARKA